MKTALRNFESSFETSRSRRRFDQEKREALGASRNATTFSRSSFRPFLMTVKHSQKVNCVLLHTINYQVPGAWHD